MFFLQDSWQQFLYDKCHNINRKKKPSEHEQPPAKKVCSISSVHSYPRIEEGEGEEDDEAYRRNVSKMEKELSLPKQKQSPSTLKDLMKRTFPQRRKWVLEDAVSSEEIWTNFPLLKNASFVSIFVS